MSLETQITVGTRGFASGTLSGAASVLPISYKIPIYALSSVANAGLYDICSDDELNLRNPRFKSLSATLTMGVFKFQGGVAYIKRFCQKRLELFFRGFYSQQIVA